MFLRDFMIGGIAAILSKTASAPIERIQLLLQTQDANIKILDKQVTKYTGIGNCFKRCVQEEGVLSLWRGNTINCVRYFPTQALNFAFKDVYKNLFKKQNTKEKPLLLLFYNAISGGAAGASAQFFVQPLDFARTRLATDIGKNKTDRQFTGFKDCVVKIYKADGIKGIFQGFQISIITFFFYRAFYFGLYDTYKKLALPKFIKKKVHLRLIFNFVNAQIITAFAGFIVFPLDTVRKRLMMQSGQSKILYSGSIDCFIKIYKKNGIFAFYKGFFSNVIRSVGASLVLVAYDEFQTLFKRMSNKNI